MSDVTPWALVALGFLLAVVVVVTGAVVTVIAVAARAPHKERPDTIRALGDFWKALLDSLFRWRRK